jgi:DNA-binding response OmpR family regulator
MSSDSFLLKAQAVHHQADDNHDVYDDGCLRIEHKSYYIACNGNMISLARKEFLIISRLARSAERIVPSEEIWRYAWGESAAFNAQSLRVHIHRIRHNLAPFCVKIESLVHVGYRLTTTPNLNIRKINALLGFTVYLSSLFSSIC